MKTPRWTTARAVAISALSLGMAAADAAPSRGLGWDLTESPETWLTVCLELGVSESGEPAIRCQTRTDWSLEHAVVPTELVQPNADPIRFTATVVEGQTHLLLDISAAVTLQASGGEHSVRAFITNLQVFEDDRFVTVASSAVGNVNPACGCGFVPDGPDGSKQPLQVALFDQSGRSFVPREGAGLATLHGGQRAVVRLEGRYDLTLGRIQPGARTRLQTCVQYAPADADLATLDLCVADGGALRAVKACTDLPFDQVEVPPLQSVQLEARILAPTAPWVSLSGFRADGTAGALELSSDSETVWAGQGAITYDVPPVGAGTVSTLVLQGFSACAVQVACDLFLDGLCDAALQGEVRLVGPDGVVDTATASTRVRCAP